MKILIDECIDQRLRHSFPEHDCLTAGFAGLTGLQNGQLLDAAESAGFDVLVTADQNIPYEQNLKGRRISILILCASTNRLRDLLALMPGVKDALLAIGLGEVITLR